MDLTPWLSRVQSDDWPRALGDPLASGRIRVMPEDFFVDEQLGFAPSGEGEFDLLRIEKRGLNTAAVAESLARAAGVPHRAVSFSGVKDRHAVTRQWFSVHRPGQPPLDPKTLSTDGVAVLESARHLRKLRRGTHRANAFRIVVRGADCDRARLADRINELQRGGFPNYFGPQRFGRSGNNLRRAVDLYSGRTRARRQQASWAHSAARSLVFNAVLARRIEMGHWDRALPGDRMSLEGSGTHFGVEQVNEELLSRCLGLDIHPTGPLWGGGRLVTQDAVAELEQAVAAGLDSLTAGLEQAGLRQERRALRSVVTDLGVTPVDQGWQLSFSLGRGCYATALLRELFLLTDAALPGLDNSRQPGMIAP